MSTDDTSPADVKSPNSLGLKLESLSKEDLIKFIKKQMLVNQKNKAKIEEVTKELEILKSTNQIKNSSLVTDEQFECMKLKQETMLAAYESTVNELNVLSDKNKDFEKKLHEIEEENAKLKQKLNSLQEENDSLMKEISENIKEKEQQQLQLQQSLARSIETIPNETQTVAKELQVKDTQTSVPPSKTTETMTAMVPELITVGTQIEEDSEVFLSLKSTVKTDTTSTSAQTVNFLETNATMTQTETEGVVSKEVQTETKGTVSKKIQTDTKGNVSKEIQTDTDPKTSELEQKLLDWEKLMKMLEKEREEVNEYLEDLFNNLKLNGKSVEKLIKTIETAIPNRDVVTEMSDINFELYSPRFPIKSLLRQVRGTEIGMSVMNGGAENNNNNVNGDGSHRNEGQQKVEMCYHDVFRQRLIYLESLLDELIFERDEIKEKVFHLSEVIIQIYQQDKNFDSDLSNGGGSVLEILNSVENRIKDQSHSLVASYEKKIVNKDEKLADLIAQNNKLNDELVDALKIINQIKDHGNSRSQVDLPKTLTSSGDINNNTTTINSNLDESCVVDDDLILASCNSTDCVLPLPCVENYLPLPSDISNDRRKIFVVDSPLNSCLIADNLKPSSSSSNVTKDDEYVDGLKLEIDNLRKEVLSKNKIVMELNVEIADLKSYFEKNLQIAQEELFVNNLLIGYLKTQIDQLSLNLTNKNDEIGDLSSKLVAKSVENDSNLAEISELSAKLSKTKELLLESSKQEVALSQKNEEFEIKREELRTEKQKYDSIKEDFNSLEGKYSNLSEKFSERNREILKYQSELGAIKQEHDEKVCTLNEELELRDEQVNKQIEEISNLRVKLENLNLIEKKYENLRSKFAENEENFVRFQSDMDRLKELHSAEIKLITDETFELKMELSDKIKENENLIEIMAQGRSQIDELRSQLDDQNLTILKLRKDIDDKTLEINELTKKLNDQNNLSLDQSLDKSHSEPKPSDLVVSENLQKSDTTTAPMENRDLYSESGSDLGDLIKELKSQLKEKEDREMKLKQLALKAKKESTELRNKLETATNELTQLKNGSSNRRPSDHSLPLYQSLQNEYEKLESAFDAEKSTNKQLQKYVEQLTLDLGQLKVTASEKDDEIVKLAEELKEFKKIKMGMEATFGNLEKELQAEKIHKSLIMQDKMALETKLAWLEASSKQQLEDHALEVKRLNEEVKVKVVELENVKKDMQQNQMISLEIADYERAMRRLNSDLDENRVKVKSIEDELTHVRQQKEAVQKLLETSEAQNKQAEEHCGKLKQLVVKMKKELADVKKQEGELSTSESQLKVQNEMLNQLAEEQKLKIAELISEKRQLTEKMASLGDSYQRSSMLLESKIANLQRELEEGRVNLKNMQSEYDGYKVRVHSVLKQQKNKNNDDIALVEEKQEREALLTMNEKLKLKITELKQQLTVATAELEQLRDDQDRQQLKQVQLVSSFEASEAAWRTKLDQLRRSHQEEVDQHQGTVQMLISQNEGMAQSFKEQHSNVVESLRQQLEKVQLELDRYRTNPNLNSAYQTSTATNGVAGKSNAASLLAGGFEERQDGEGSESTESIDMSKLVQSSLSASSSSASLTLMSSDAKQLPAGATAAALHQQQQQQQQQLQQSSSIASSSSRKNSFVPFEVLLSNHSVPSSLNNDDDVNHEIEKENDRLLGNMLLASQRQGEHLRQLLNESEATVLRLTEQAAILKSEIRRLERNQERETSVSNMEYLKNVIYKFMTLKSGDEKIQLVPVLNTMLKFSTEEKQTIAKIATGVELGGGANVSSSDAGWVAYLPKWPGII